MSEAPHPDISHEWSLFDKKKVDQNEYIGLIMKNGMKCMVVEDPDALVASVSVSVAVGNLNNPRSHDGLAHLVEHLMIYKTIPCAEGKFFKFLGNYGGDCNADTTDDFQYYHYRVPSDHLEATLKQFIHLFKIEPENSFTLGMLSYELNALDSEFKETMSTHDQRRHRTVQLAGDETNRLCAENRFYKGNCESLSFGDPLRNKCVQFAKEHFKPAYMTISIISNQERESVKNWIIDTFAQLEHLIPIQASRSTESLYSFDGSDKIPEITSICNDGPDRLNRLDIVFSDVYIIAKPLDLLITLISHRGPGSLLHALRTQHNFEPSKSGAAYCDKGSFYICLTRIDPFSEEEKWSAVVLTLQYLETVKKWANSTNHTEHHQLEQIFKQSQNDVPFEFGECYGPNYARALHGQLTGSFDQFNTNLFVDRKASVAKFSDHSTAFADTLSNLRVDKMHLVMMTTVPPTGVQLMRDEIYKLDYFKRKTKCRPDIEAQLQDQIPNFVVPSPSLYLPDPGQLTISNYEAQRRTNSSTRISTFGHHSDWMFIDNRSQFVKIGILLKGDNLLTDIEYIFLRTYIIEFINTNSSLMDQAKHAHIELDFDVDAYGIQVTIKGFNHMLEQFIAFLLGKFCGHTNSVPTIAEFERTKKELTYNLAFPGGSVIDELRARMSALLGQIKYPLSAADVMSESVVVFTRDFLSKCTMKLFVCGSTTDEQCIRFRDTCERQFSEAFQDWANRVQPKLVCPEVKLARSASCLTSYRGEETDRATNGYSEFYQIVSDNASRVKDYALLSLLRLTLEPLFYRMFRFSEEHPPSGYSSNLVQCLNSHSIGLALLLQPDGAHNFERCSQMIETMFSDLKNKLKGLSADSLAIFKKGLRDIIFDDFNLNPFEYYWKLMKLNDDLIVMMNTATLFTSIESITKVELNAFFDCHFDKTEYRRLVVALPSQNVRVVGDPSTFEDRLRQRATVTDIASFVESSAKC